MSLISYGRQIALALALFAIPQFVRADFLQLDFPGATSTVAWAIDGTTVVGRESGPTGSYGFIYNGSTWTTFTPSTHGELRGISGSNLVGIYQGLPEQPFISNGSVTTPINVPGADYSTVLAVSGTTALGISYQGSTPTPFLLEGSTITPVPLPAGAQPRGLSGNTIVGSLDATRSFIIDGTTLSTLTVPGALTTYASSVSGMNVAGNYTDASGNNHGFLYNGATFTTIDIPGLSNFSINGISGNTIVGSYQDPNTGAFHSFEETVGAAIDPVATPEPGSLTLSLGGALGLLTYLRRRRRG